MSFSVVNMCRVVITVIFFLFGSCVLSGAQDATANKTNCLDNPAVKQSRMKIKKCFHDLVAESNSSTPTGKRSCENVGDFSKILTSHYITINETCNANHVTNTTHLMNFIDYSLNNLSFTEFYKDIECVKRVERQVSQCVKHHVGFFNITAEKKHSSWYHKLHLTYDDKSCKQADKVKTCVDGVLKPCKSTTRQYLASLFEFSKQNCGNLTQSNEPDTAASAPHLSVPAIIGISVGAALSVIAFS